MVSTVTVPYLHGIEPGVRVPPGVREDILGVRKIKKYITSWLTVNNQGQI
jgi:hypothetical protein